MIKPLFVFFAATSFFTLNAQDTLIGKKPGGRFKVTYEKPVRDTVIPAGPNEIYLNIAPVMTMLLGASTYETNFSLYYKRALKNPRWAFRTGLSFKPQATGFYYFGQEEWVFNQTDSTRTLNQFQRGRVNKFQLNAGMEYRSKGIKRWSTFAGLDVIGGYYSESYVLYDIQQQLDSTGQWDYSESRMLDYEKGNNFYVGLSPKLGLRYAFSPRWMLAVQMGADFAFYKGEYLSRNGMGTQIISRKTSYFEFDMSGPVEEISIVYRF